MEARLRHVRGAALGWILTLGCTGVVGQEPSTPGERPPAPPTPVDEEPPPRGSAAAPPPVVVPGAAPGGGAVAAACSVRSVAAPAPLRRLTNVQYRNTIRALFPRVDLPANDLDLPSEVATQGFLNVAKSQAVSAESVEELQRNARAIARAVTADLTKLLPCRPATAADEPACGRAFVRAFGRQAFRRPLGADELGRLDEFLASARTRWGFATALRLLVEAVLQAPAFLYRVEPLGGAADAGAVALGDHELATRLAYFLTDSMPDAALMAAADAGTLRSRAGLETEARRLLSDARARAAVAAFHAQWLHLDRVRTLEKSVEAFPRWSAATAQALEAATLRYADDLFWDGGRTLKAFFTDDHAFVNDAIAPLYGLTRTSPSLTRERVDGRQRAGMITQAGLMAALAHERTSAPVLRGVFVLDRFLCAAPPPPPAGVDTDLAEPPAGARLTTRQQLEQSHAAPVCAACHAAIDGIGFGFEHYDAVGQWRLQDNGSPVDARGSVVGAKDIEGPYTGAVELGAKLASSAQVRQCVVRQWAGYAFGVSRDEVPPCAAATIDGAFVAANGDFRALLLAIVTSDAFRFRPADNQEDRRP